MPARIYLGSYSYFFKVCFFRRRHRINFLAICLILVGFVRSPISEAFSKSPLSASRRERIVYAKRTRF